MTPFWSIVVIVLVVANIIGCLWLLIWTAKRTPGESADTGHVWDDDLREYNNPLPRWWLWLFVLSVVFAVAYAVLYPTLGNSKGTLGWTQIKQWEQMQAEQEKQAQVILAKFADRAAITRSCAGHGAYFQPGYATGARRG